MWYCNTHLKAHQDQQVLLSHINNVKKVSHGMVHNVTTVFFFFFCIELFSIFEGCPHRKVSEIHFCSDCTLSILCLSGERIDIARYQC